MALFVFVALTQDLKFVIIPKDVVSCPGYEQVKAWMIETMPVTDIMHWSYQCFTIGTAT